MTDRVEAKLVYDTKAEPQRQGVRAVVQRARRMLYSADDTEVVLQVAPDKQADKLKLAGQVFDEGIPLEGAAVNLHGVKKQVEDATDEEGEFLIGSLPRGAYSLEIETPGRTLSVKPLEIE